MGSIPQAVTPSLPTAPSATELAKYAGLVKAGPAIMYSMEMWKNWESG